MFMSALARYVTDFLKTIPMAVKCLYKCVLNLWGDPCVYTLISVNDSLNNGLSASCDASRMLVTCWEEHTSFLLFSSLYFSYNQPY